MDEMTIDSTDKLLSARQLNPRQKVQQYIDSEVLRLCSPLVPLRGGDLLDSGTINTKIGDGIVKYCTPYARHLYYLNSMESAHADVAVFGNEPSRGSYWFERMKKDGGRDEILKGAQKIAGAEKGTLI